jgi:Ca2+-binding RTX toxin-like protein
MTRRFGTIIVTAAIALLATSAVLAQPTTVTFDNGYEGWGSNGSCNSINPDNGNPGNYWNFTSFCDDVYNLNGWFETHNDTNPAFVGDFTAKGPMRIELDIDVEFYYFWNWGTFIDAEEWRELIVELRDYDNPYVDPDTGASWPWTSVWYNAGPLPHRDTGWAHYVIDVPDVLSTELPDGWRGYGGPEDPVNYTPQLPPDRTWTDVLAGVDEIRITTLNLDYFYSLTFVHNVNFDNITIRSIPQMCGEHEATIFVDPDGIIHGGPFDGMQYNGNLFGTDEDDVIAGTGDDDHIKGFGGNDIICGHDGRDVIQGGFDNDLIDGGEGDDNINGQVGDDMLAGGLGRDTLHGGPGEDTCIGGEVTTSCGHQMESPGFRPTPAPVYQEQTEQTEAESTFGR